MRKNKLPLFDTPEEAEKYLLDEGFEKRGNNSESCLFALYVKEPVFDDGTYYRITADLFNISGDMGFGWYIYYSVSFCVKDTQNDVSLMFSDWAVEDIEEWVGELHKCGLVTPKSPKAKTPH